MRDNFWCLVQKDLVLKLHHLLEQEADELKRLLGAKAGAIGDQSAVSNESATQVTLARLKTDIASRRLHETGVATLEVRKLDALATNPKASDCRRQCRAAHVYSS